MEIARENTELSENEKPKAAGNHMTKNIPSEFGSGKNPHALNGGGAAQELDVNRSKLVEVGCA